MVAAVAVVAWAASGRRSAIVTSICLGLIILLGLWAHAMATLANVLVGTVLTLAFGLVKDDNVDIYYKVTGGKKIAAMVTKDDTVYESEVAEGEDVIDDFSDDDVDPQTNSVNEVPAIVPGNEINE